MKFAASFGLFTASVVSAVVVHPEFHTRADLPSPKCRRYQAQEYTTTPMIHLVGSCYPPQVYNCIANLNDTEDLWSKNSRVAAATCQGTYALVKLAQCHDSDIGNASDLSHLSYGIYANIGAWQEGGCPITF
ncbi:hypothetical protein DFS33DRAFT_1277853 [Desarmillaria ectypa]|nr:hypothetical protein DFS33DRAFT_1277853 [Desarmillaria ectypa]